MSLTGLLAILALASAGFQAPADGAADRAELLRLETVWNDAHVRGDADALDALWADELAVTVPGMQVFTKPQSLCIWRSGRMKFQRYETSGAKVQLFGDAAVVTGRLRRTRSISERVVEDDWQFSKMYVRRGGKWRVVAFHASEAPK